MNESDIVHSPLQLSSTPAQSIISDVLSPIQLSASQKSQCIDTPRKVRLRKRNSDVSRENSCIKTKVRCFEKELEDAVTMNNHLLCDINEKESEVADIKESIVDFSPHNKQLADKFQEERQLKITTQKRFAATKRHLKDAKITMSKANIQSKCSSRRTNSKMSCLTDVYVCGGPPVNVVAVGKLYPGSVGRRQLTGGKSTYIAKIPIHSVDSVNAIKDVQARAKDGFNLLNYVAACEEKQSTENIKTLMIEMMKQQPDFFTKCAEAGISNSKKLSPLAAVELQSLLRITDNKMRDLRTILSNFDANVLPSAWQMNRVKKEKLSHVKKSKLECGEMYLRKSQRDTRIDSCPFVRTTNLIEYIEEILKNSSFNPYIEFNDTIWLLFSGDKCGDSMKFVFSVVNDIKNGS